MRITTALVMSLALAGTLSACATQQTTATGFLSAPPTTAPAGVVYTAVLIEQPQFRAGPNAPTEAKAEDVDALLAHYRGALVAEFGRRWRLVDAPGPGVLRVRSALTGYDLANVRLNIVSTPLVGPMSNGGAASEAEVVDSVTNAGIAAHAGHANGNLFRTGPRAFYRARGHAEAALTAQARALAERTAQALDTGTGQ